jgi:hypothetical protein
MGVLCIQVQPNLAPGIDLGVVREVAAQLGSTTLFTRHGEEEGFDNGPYINLYFDTPSLPEAWPIIWSQFYEDARIGTFLRASSIATCEGKNGWDDYLLLHHFDPTESVDDIGKTGKQA